MNMMHIKEKKCPSATSVTTNYTILCHMQNTLVRPIYGQCHTQNISPSSMFGMTHIQGVTGGMCETLGECSLCQTIPM